MLLKAGERSSALVFGRRNVGGKRNGRYGLSEGCISRRMYKNPITKPREKSDRVPVAEGKESRGGT